jgi:tetratricopeptide (TPR) repeat protein
MRIASERGHCAAYIGDNVYSVPEAMASVVATLASLGYPSKGFEQRYKTYQQHRRELEADPNAPEGALSFFTKTAVRVGMRMARDVPVVGAIATTVNEDAAAEQVDRFRSYLSTKLHNHDDLGLVLSPTEVLTPLFVQGLTDAASQRPVVLFVDTYERTAPFLDTWLLELLDGAYGELPLDLTIVVAGQYPLDPNRWAPYVSVIRDVPLDVFTEDETRQLLVQRGVTDEEDIESVIESSGRLPLLVAMLASGLTAGNRPAVDASDSAVERFLRWEHNEERRTVAIAASIPRYFNEDILGALVAPGAAAELTEWLRTQPFVTEHPAGYQYHRVVRTQMIRLARRRAPEGWRHQHEVLADQFEQWRQTHSGEEESNWDDALWQGYVLEESYHRLCAALPNSLPEALDWTVDAYQSGRAIARRWAEMLVQAGIDADMSNVLDLGRQLQDHATTSEESWARFLDVLIDEGSNLRPDRLVTALNERATCNRRLRRYDAALADCDRALELSPNNRHSWHERILALDRMGRTEDALADLDELVRKSPNDVGPIMWRSHIYIHLKRYEDAVNDLKKLIEIYPQHRGLLAHRGEVYYWMDRYNEAIADLTKVIEFEAEPYARTVAHRGASYRELGRFDEAIADFDRVLEMEPEDSWAMAERGETYRLLGRFQEALSDLDRAIELTPDDHWAFARRGCTYRELGRFDDAFNDLREAIRMNPTDCWAMDEYAGLCIAAGREAEAFVYVEPLVAENPDDAHWQLHYADVEGMLGRYDEALRRLNRVLELDLSYESAVREREERIARLAHSPDASGHEKSEDQTNEPDVERS